MKHYALPLLEAVPEDNVRRGELLELIDAFQFSSPSTRSWWTRAHCSGSLSAAALTTMGEELGN